ncbi:ECF RNA polymerase sigma factor SigK [Paramicrobacterium chengjingii]|uniref:ECF RNA polymerase sigma factor SigK n=1 Tax=Paramicrobacterium chengjingii TaxID=2769067 RepID=A0ABX6YGX6_9MICO|nr:ECF RNA polymerase sigma factor SigK [Microbacterium chengjingii]QPZ38007.1 ECF RNA polymerase sigma factor SigK [Microbacterium chengjingii]
MTTETGAPLTPRNEPSHDIAALLSAVASGDQRAFGSLYDAVASRVHGLVRRILIDDAQSEEVTQEIFLEIWQAAPRFDASRGSALGWIFTLAHRRAVDRVRSAQSSRERDERIAKRDTDATYDPVAEEGDARIEGQRVHRAMRGLSEAQREAITLAYYGGFSQSEIAERLGIPIGTVKTRLRDGMIRLRSLLGVTT